MPRMAIAASREPRLIPARLETPREETWPGRDLAALEETVEMVLHYRDRHVSPRGGRERVEFCSCPAFDPTDDGFRCAVHVAVLRVIEKWELPELLRTLGTLSPEPMLRPSTHDFMTAAA